MSAANAGEADSRNQTAFKTLLRLTQLLELSVRCHPFAPNATHPLIYSSRSGHVTIQDWICVLGAGQAI
ncbi:hypothetical protein CU102_23205 [Phyllobacterium brassicacearum]|uniref:Uncharacterized protein n=1 Tax=Phyllobacterium brassicacearum TaxID=314235 RepID=A0A2P7BBB9_9HYPH|nr:hypothetical protein [Phyllobacterium brassicacearum]PSH63767.1 hypothetical protein CU102_23205 [Phyllobacterium brassicacearum]